MQNIIKTSTAIALFFLFGACSSLKASVEEGADLSAGRTYYVAHQEKDERAINEMIAKRLGATGRQATTGELADIPSGTQVLVTYEDRWAWDITMYMRSLQVVFRDPHTEAIMATGTSKRDSLTRKGVESVVDEVVNEIFSKVDVEEAAAPAP